MSPPVWSWPPPGLERLRGVLPAAARRGATATVLAGPPLLWITIAREPVAAGAAGNLLSALLLLGLLLYLGAILRASAAIDLARRAARLGYSRGLILDLLADRTADTPALVQGTGEYADMRPRLRETIRRLRRWAAITHALAALLPLPLLCLGVWLALHGAAARLSVALLLIAPLVLLGAATLLLRGYAVLLGQWERGAEAWDPSPVTERDRATEWQVSFEGGAKPRAAGGLLPIIAFAGVGIVCFVALFVTIAGMGALAGWAGREPRSRILEDAAGLARVELVRTLRSDVDSTITRERAGAALHDLLLAAGDVRTGMRPAVRTLPPLWDGQRPPPMNAEIVWRMLLGDSAAPPVPEWSTLREHPGLAELAILARAPGLDPIGARWHDHVPPSDFSGLQVEHRLLPLRFARDAALALRDGRADRARVILTDLLSAGLLLVDHGRTPADLHLGRSMVDVATALLLRLDPAALPRFAETGDVIDRALRRSHTATWAASSPDRGDLRRAILDTLLYPAIRWDAFRQLQQRLRCGSPGAVLFGESPELVALHDEVRRTLVRAPGDSLAFAALTHPEPASIRDVPRWNRRVLRAAEFFGGRNLVENPCFSAFSRGF